MAHPRQLAVGLQPVTAQMERRLEVAQASVKGKRERRADVLLNTGWSRGFRPAKLTALSPLFASQIPTLSFNTARLLVTAWWVDESPIASN